MGALLDGLPREISDEVPIDEIGSTDCVLAAKELAQASGRVELQALVEEIPSLWQIAIWVSSS